MEVQRYHFRVLKNVFQSSSVKMVKTDIMVRLETLVVNQLVRKTNVAHTGQITDASGWC